MFYILIQLSIIPICCGVYLHFKNKIRSYRNIDPVTVSQDIHMILLIAYCMLFILSGGFVGLSANGPTDIYLKHYENSDLSPLQRIKEYQALVQFYQHVTPDFSSEKALWMFNEHLDFFKDLGRIFLAYIPIAIGIISVHKRFITGLFMAVVLESLLYIQTGRAFIGASIVISGISFGMIFLLNRVILERFSLESLRTRVLAISILAMCLFLVGNLITVRRGMFYGGIKYIDSNLVLSDQGLILRKPEIADMYDSVQIEGDLDDTIVFELPYQIAEKTYRLPYKCSDLDLEVPAHQKDRFYVNFWIYDPVHPGHYNVVEKRSILYPITIKGVSQIIYKIEDPKLLEQIEVIDENWTEIVPYPIYEVTYRIPKFEGYTSVWHRIQNIKLKAGIEKQGSDTMYPYYSDAVQTIDEGNTMKVMMRYAYYGVDFNEIESTSYTLRDVELIKAIGSSSDEPVLVIEGESYFD